MKTITYLGMINKVSFIELFYYCWYIIIIIVIIFDTYYLLLLLYAIYITYKSNLVGGSDGGS